MKLWMTVNQAPLLMTYLGLETWKAACLPWTTQWRFSKQPLQLPCFRFSDRNNVQRPKNFDVLEAGCHSAVLNWCYSIKDWSDLSRCDRRECVLNWSRSWTQRASLGFWFAWTCWEHLNILWVMSHSNCHTWGHVQTQGNVNIYKVGPPNDGSVPFWQKLVWIPLFCFFW